MKKFRLTICVLLTVISMLLNTVCAFASTPKNSGHLDSIDGNKVSGWAWNSAAPDTPVSVTVTVANSHTGESLLSETAEADIERNDLKESGIGNGAHGFEIMIDWSSIPDDTYMIKLSVNGTALPLAYQYNTATKIIKNATLVSLGTFKTTAYCPCRSCSEGYGRLTKTGTQATASRTVAVDPRVIPLGSHLLIDGVEYIAEDVGGGVKGKHIDIFYNTHSETRDHGVERSEVYLIQSKVHLPRYMSFHPIYDRTGRTSTNKFFLLHGKKGNLS